LHTPSKPRTIDSLQIGMNWFDERPGGLDRMVSALIQSLISVVPTGSVTLTATAVDDRAVAGVQFQMNGQNIGAEVASDAPSGDGANGTTKYLLTWDSHGVPNGTYTLTAIARDPASRFLIESLNTSLESKVELLRIAAALPNRS